MPEGTEHSSGLAWWGWGRDQRGDKKTIIETGTSIKFFQRKYHGGIELAAMNHSRMILELILFRL